MDAFQKIKGKIFKSKRFNNKYIDKLNEDKLLKYLEKCENLGVDTLTLALERKKSTEVITKMIDLGGRPLLMGKNIYLETALHVACRKASPIEVIMKMIDVGGRQLLTEKNKYGATALYYACENEASTEVIMRLASGHNSGDEIIKQTVDAAVEAMAIAQKRSVIHIAAEYGLKWSIHTKDLVESNIDQVVDGYDSSTGLRLFMIAAMGNSGGSDLSSIYGLMRINPL